MNRIYNPKLTGNARALRKNMTKEERRLWYDFLKTLPATVQRQKTIGPYIVDFYCAKHRLVIELDGSQHFEAAGLEADRKRDAALREMGFSVLRYSNADVTRRFEGVCEDILQHMSAQKASP